MVKNESHKRKASSIGSRAVVFTATWACCVFFGVPASASPGEARCAVGAFEPEQAMEFAPLVKTDSGPFASDILLESSLPAMEILRHAPLAYSAINGKAFALERNEDGIQATTLPTALRPYEVYGVSSDGSSLLYRALTGNRPSGDLYVENLDTHGFARVSDRLVLEAAWSPTEPGVVAYTYAAGDHFALEIIDANSGALMARAPGAVHADWLEWDASGDGIHYMRSVEQVRPIVDPKSGLRIEEYPYSVLIPSYLPVSAERALAGAEGEAPAGFPIPDRATRVGEFSQALSSGEEGLPSDLYAFRAYSPDYSYEVIGDNLLGSAGIYLRAMPSGSLAKVGEGSLLEVLDEGILLRTYSDSISSLRFVPWDAQGEDDGLLIGNIASVTYKLPMNNLYVTQIGSGYGVGCYSNHTGTMAYAYDMAYGYSGEHIMAVADGMVVSVKSDVNCNSCDSSDCSDYSSSCSANGGWGNTIVIEHSDGTYTMYNHLEYNSPRVSPGSSVCAGLHIANQGHTGCAIGTYCGDHLHFQRQSGASTSSQSISISFADANNPLTCSGLYHSGLSETSSCGGSSTTVVVDDQDSGFMKFGPGIYWSEASIGYGSHMWYTYVNGDTVSNFARWRPMLDGPGDYQVYVFVPSNYATSQTAQYRIRHRGASEYASVNQSIYYDQWVSIGTYSFFSSGFEIVELTDATGESGDTGRMIGFDAVKFVKQ